MPNQWRSGATHVQSVVVEACWRPMTGDVAGDFHEVVDLRDGSVAVVVGDAVGYGAEAAAIAELLRSRVRAELQRSRDPAAVLSALDGPLAEAGGETIATAVCAVIDPARREVLVSSAGHPPAVLVDGAEPALLDGEPDPPLGIPSQRRSVRHALHADAALFLYTDGLIERRGTSIGDSIDTLLRASAGLVGARGWATELARRATDTFGSPSDDATVVSVRVAEPPADGDAPPVVRRRVVLRLYVDPADLRNDGLRRTVAALARHPDLEVHVEEVDVTSRSTHTEDAGVLAAPTIIRVVPEPAVRAIGWFDSVRQLATALQLPVPEEGPGDEARD